MGEKSIRDGQIIVVKGKHDYDADCHWCGRVIAQSAMKPKRIKNIIVYVCNNCQPK